MIQHIVLLKWKPGTTDEQIEAAFGQAQHWSMRSTAWSGSRWGATAARTTTATPTR